METASQRLLDYIDKRMNLEEMGKVLQWTDEAGIWCGVEIIVGLPFDTDEDIEDTISFLNKHQEYIDRVYIEPFTMRDWSRLVLEPERFNLRNVFKINQYGKKSSGQVLDRVLVRYGFDEINGLVWDEKINQINNSYDRISHFIGGGEFPHYEEEHFLFFLYSRLENKKEIRSVFNRVKEAKLDCIKRLQMV
jgi:hypothetical protein